ncbi:MAG: hypothetical protein PUK81_05365, partial [Firmicutes bacterium]|nr:hypothetical protein [Bacillota bacterium]
PMCPPAAGGKRIAKTHANSQKILEYVRIRPAFSEKCVSVPRADTGLGPADVKRCRFKAENGAYYLAFA